MRKNHCRDSCCFLHIAAKGASLPPATEYHCKRGVRDAPFAKFAGGPARRGSFLPAHDCFESLFARSRVASVEISGEPMSVKVLVADDHEVVRTGLASLSGRFGHQDRGRGDQRRRSRQAGRQAQAGRRAVGHSHARQRRPGSAGQDPPRSCPNTRVVMLSTYDNPTYVARAVALGASDYVLKGASRQAADLDDYGRGRRQEPLRVAANCSESPARWQAQCHAQRAKTFR